MALVRKFKGVDSKALKWQVIHPNEKGDWLNQRDGSFEIFIKIGDKDDKKNKQTFFSPIYARGIGTSRDVWAYNYSKIIMLENMRKSDVFFQRTKK